MSQTVKRYIVTLSTPTGDCSAPLTLATDQTPQTDPTAVVIQLCYQGKSYCGKGRDHLWIESVADLQKQLPPDVAIHCCLTCRHGNLYPAGNDPDRFWCLKDAVPKDKDDVWALLDEDKDIEGRRRAAFGICPYYAPQGKEFYTYNDYLYWLEKQ